MLQIFKIDVQEEIHFTGHGKAGDDFGPALYGLPEGADRLGIALFQCDPYERLQAEPDPAWLQEGNVLADDAALFQLLEATQAG